MNLFDQIVLLLTGLTAVYLIWRFVQDSAKNTYYILSFAVLFVAGVLLIFLTYGALANPAVVIVSYLIPFCLALGLVAEFYPEKSKLYMIFGLIGLLGIAYTRYTDSGTLATVVLATFHFVAGMIILLVPIFVTRAKKAPSGFIWVAVGGLLINIGGTSLAFLKMGTPILSGDLIFMILAPLLFLMTLSYTWGFMKKMRA
ncbi:MAG: hypothetical protein DWQ05_22285 [Calditrichaeota bacterium]|nr:MAG: hypothetical protein DWQ05_22285 [Calditrichota bacterium]